MHLYLQYQHFRPLGMHTLYHPRRQWRPIIFHQISCICSRVAYYARRTNCCVQFHKTVTRHRASTSMYSLTFCVRVTLPERHQWKPAVQSAAVMLRTPPVDGQSPASQPRPLPIYGAHSQNAPRHPPVTGQRRAQTPPRRLFALSHHFARWTQACNWGSRYVAMATQPVPRLQIRPIVHN